MRMGIYTIAYDLQTDSNYLGRDRVLESRH